MIPISVNGNPSKWSTVEGTGTVVEAVVEAAPVNTMYGGALGARRQATLSYPSDEEGAQGQRGRGEAAAVNVRLHK